MPRSKLIVDVEVLADHLPLISQAARIVGSADHEGDRALALIIEGESVPDCLLCECQVLTLYTATDTRLVITFKPA